MIPTMTYHIPFTRFSLPDGRRSEDIMTTRDVAVAEAYDRIHKEGFYMAVEMLSTGEIAAYISDGTEADMGDIACIVHSNGPGLPEAIGAMMKAFTPEGAAEWRRGQEELDSIDAEMAAEEAHAKDADEVLRNRADQIPWEVV